MATISEKLARLAAVRAGRGGNAGGGGGGGGGDIAADLRTALGGEVETAAELLARRGAPPMRHPDDAAASWSAPHVADDDPEELAALDALDPGFHRGADDAGRAGGANGDRVIDWCPGAARRIVGGAAFAQVTTTLAARCDTAGEGPARFCGHPLVAPVAADAWHGEAATLLFGNDAAGALALDRIAFLDTETTGLDRGPGTYAFLVGVGWFEGAGAAFRVEQLLMEDFADEPAQLAALDELLAGFDAIVTYNGRAFDAPLLESRFVMNRLRSRLGAMAHLDLLHPSRRLWRRAAGGGSLQQMEQRVLGVARAYDVSGRLIPRIFFDYARGRHRRRMRAVLHHNLQDVVSMADLVGEACRLIVDPDSRRGAGARDSADTFRGLGRLFAARRCDDRRTAALETAMALARGAEAEGTCRAELAAAYKRERRWDEARPLWELLARDRDEAAATAACVELAKHHEHRTRDLDAALTWCRRAASRLAIRRDLDELAGGDGAAPPSAAMRDMLADLARREKRLGRRLAKRAADSPARATAAP